MNYKYFILLFITLVLQVPGVAVADETVSEYTIKAAFIYNFARFTQWADDSSELKVCIYGKDPFGNNIDALHDKQSNARTIKIIRTQLIEEVATCHIAFLNIIPPERHLFEKALSSLEGKNVLTIADADNVIDFGVMIGLVIEDDKVGFKVNHSHAKASHIAISAKLLRLAKEVI